MKVLEMLAMENTVSSLTGRCGANSAFPALPSQVWPSGSRTATWRPATRSFPVVRFRMASSLRCVASSRLTAPSGRAGEADGMAGVTDADGGASVTDADGGAEAAALGDGAAAPIAASDRAPSRRSVPGLARAGPRTPGQGRVAESGGLTRYETHR